MLDRKSLFNRIWRINAKSYPFTHAFMGVRFRWFGRALAWHARGHRSDPGNLHQNKKHRTEMCGAFLFTQTQQKAGASHKRKATTFTVADPKFMLDICAKLWYNAFCNCGYSTSASISAFQAEEVGSIPIARSMQKAPWLFGVTVLLFCFIGPTCRTGR